MASRTRPYDTFGPFILFKRLETDALGDLWRAARVEDGRAGGTVALRRLTGGSREALASNARAVSQILPLINGASFVRDQQAGVVEGVPYVSWEYGGGRSLRHIMNRARGGADSQPNPLPLDQAIVIAEKIALSLATMADLRDASGSRLGHGALLPQFVWVSDDGEIRVAGQQLGSAIIASFSDAKLALDLGRYFSPDYRVSGVPQKNTDVYSMGAILFLLVTGQEPPDALTASAFGSAVRAAKTMTGEPVPADIRAILDKSFNIDPAMRYDAMSDMKQALSALVSSGNYSATTFNLAFYLTTLLKKELDDEAAEREVEAKVNIAAYAVAEAPAPVAAPAPTPRAAAAPAPSAPAVASPLSAPAFAKKKSRAPLAAVAAIVAVALGGAGWMMYNKTQTAAPAAQVVAAQTLVPAGQQPSTRIIAEPISVTPTEMTTQTATTDSAAAAATDAEAQKKAFEEAVRRKLEAEMLKLQNEHLAELKRQQSRNAPVPVAAAPAAAAPPVTRVEEERVPSAAQLDAQRRQEAEAAARTATAAPAVAATPQVAQTQTVPTQQPPAAQPAVAAPAVREGDVVEIGAVDVTPRRLQMARPQYPPVALRQKIEATIFMTVLVSETGEVKEVRVLRGEPRFGMNDAAVRAMKSARFAPAMKDGKRVKTWMLQSIEFRQQ